MKFFIKKFSLLFVGMSFASIGYCQETQQLLDQVTQTYGGDSSGNLIGGFSMWGLMGSLIFGAVGFVAFVYGKKNASYKPMILGILLMGYPYFVRSTVMMYLVGGGLTAALYFLRD